MKPIKPSLQIALRALMRNKLQTGLTMVGMTIGVATVLTMVALGSGAQRAIEDQVRAAGMNLIIVTAGNYKPKGIDDSNAIEDNQAMLRAPEDKADFLPAVYDPRMGAKIRRVFHPEDDPMEKHDHPLASQRLGDSEAGLGAAATLLSADADAIRKVPGVQHVSEGVHENIHAVAGDKRWFTRLHGDDVELPDIKRAWVFPHGRFYSRREEKNAEQVAVLGSVAAEKLFGNTNPVGQKIFIWKQQFEVVGVLATSSWLVAPNAGDDQFDAVYVPFTTVHKLLNLSKLNDITITTASSGDVSKTAVAITNLLRQRHKITDKMADDFTVATQAKKALAAGGMRPEVARSVVGNVAGLEKITLEQVGKTLDRASSTMTALLASIAAVSLLVGGIGIMNIMLLSVVERTREIGIRRAVGARAEDVLRQFLVEAVLLSGAGGIAGILIGLALTIAISQMAKWSVSISFVAILIAAGMAACVGVFFGYYPARQASQVQPLEALRYE